MLANQVLRKTLPAVLAAALSTKSLMAGVDLPTNAPAEADPRASRMAWWRDARFGLFIHWGIYSVPAGVYEGKPVGGGEWIMCSAKIPVSTYADYAKQFDASHFDADAIAKTAKDAGMKYVVITAKHHDGFAMFHTAVDSYNVFDATPFHRDPVAELSAACHKIGLKFGVYYSQGQDWHHPGGGIAVGKAWDDAQKGEFADYLQKVSLPQVKELLTHYGPIDVLWYDTPTVKMTKELAAPFKALMHQLQPDMLVNDRLSSYDRGDFETPEQFVPPRNIPDDWETCMTMNGSWGYVARDQKYKPVVTLLRNLCASAARGGNYLLNVGPDSHGQIPQPQLDRLHAVGEWLKINGDAIYGTTAGPFSRPLPFGVATAKPGKLYLHVFDRPADRTLWLPVRSPITRAYLLADPTQALTLAPRDGGITVRLPETATDENPTVVVLEHSAALDTFAPPTVATPEGAFALNLSNCDITGVRLLTGWTKQGPFPVIDVRKSTDTAVWTAAVTKPGTYDIKLAYASNPTKPSRAVLTCGGQRIDINRPKAEEAAAQWVTVSIGTLDLPAGETTISLTGADAPDAAPLRFGSLTLTPR